MFFLGKYRLIQQKRHYKIKWKGHPTPTWEPEENIPSELRQEFHIRKTNAGARRKQRKKNAKKKNPSL